jgi:hypothetical protein
MARTVRLPSSRHLALAGALLTAVALACTHPGPQPAAAPEAATPVKGTAPPRDYVILIHYELGMHCTGFDFSYCCILPPYNSILAQIVRTGRGDGPEILGPDPQDPEVLLDGGRRLKLRYTHEDAAGKPNTHSEHKKLLYWGAEYERRTLASQQFRHLYVYEDLKGSNATGTTADAKKLRVGEAYHIKVDRGPTNQRVANDFLRNSGPTGTIVFTDSPALENVPVELTLPYTWEALGLPLTPFNDYVQSVFFLEEKDIRPFQRAVVTLVDADTEEPILDRDGKPVQGFGTNPIDVPACDRCHGTDNANGDTFRKYQVEYDFWRNKMRTGEWFARLKSAAISILEIHDARHGTAFTAHYPAGGTLVTRLGHDSVRCQDCHADNVIGVLSSRRVRDVPARERGPDFARLNPDPDHLISPLTEAIHITHQTHRPSPDAHGRTGLCQGCHPAHRDDGGMASYPIAADGSNPYAQADNRDAAGGCFVGRDVHSNPDKERDVPGPSHLNAVGHWLRDNVYGEGGQEKGLWCTHCHNRLAQELYKGDHLTDAVAGEGETLRNKSLGGIAAALGVDEATLIRDYLDPRVPITGPDEGSGVLRTWDRRGQTIAPIAVIKANPDGSGPALTDADEDGDRSVIPVSPDPLSGAAGIVVPYDAATHGRDYWLAAGSPHCADCHTPPFVESEGGHAFPIDQPGKYALMRHSTGHSGIHCQGCHESIHGLYPVTPDVDTATYAQAASINPDRSHGPIKCGACHRVNQAGVPVVLAGVSYRGRPLETDLELAVEYAHTLR